MDLKTVGNICCSSKLAHIYTIEGMDSYDMFVLKTILDDQVFRPEHGTACQ